jgi:hypothetical protein
VPKGGVEGEKVGESDAVLRSCGLSGLREGDPAQAPPPESSSWLEVALTALGGVYRVYSPIFSKAALATGVGLVLADDLPECGERRLGVSSQARIFFALVALRRPEATLTPPVMLSSLRTISSEAKQTKRSHHYQAGNHALSEPTQYDLRVPSWPLKPSQLMTLVRWFAISIESSSCIYAAVVKISATHVAEAKPRAVSE